MRSIGHTRHAGRFPIHRDLASFDFAAAKLDKALIDRLATLEFTEAAHNVVMIGGTVFRVFSLVIVLRYPSTGKSAFADLWFGRSKDVQINNGFVDAKVWLYLVGAVMLQLNVLSFAAFHLAKFSGGNINPGFLLGCAMLTWFCCEYLT